VAKRKELKKRTWKSTVREYIEAIALAIVVTLFVRTFIIQAFRIPTGSMTDTLLEGDFLFVNKFIYGAQIPFTNWQLPRVRDPRPGDIIVFKYPEDLKRDFIKRCVAVGGQTIEIRDKEVYVDGRKQNAPYVKHIDDRVYSAFESPRDNFGPFYVPKGYLFMMGDNRDNSHDSRFWGPLDEKLVKGEALILYWSWDRDHFRPRLNRLFHLIK
jgi:signal peptidase I